MYPRFDDRGYTNRLKLRIKKWNYKATSEYNVWVLLIEYKHSTLHQTYQYQTKYLNCDQMIYIQIHLSTTRQSRCNKLLNRLLGLPEKTLFCRKRCSINRENKVTELAWSLKIIEHVFHFVSIWRAHYTSKQQREQVQETPEYDCRES